MLVHAGVSSCCYSVVIPDAIIAAMKYIFTERCSVLFYSLHPRVFRWSNIRSTLCRHLMLSHAPHIVLSPP